MQKEEEEEEAVASFSLSAASQPLILWQKQAASNGGITKNEATERQALFLCVCVLAKQAWLAGWRVGVGVAVGYIELGSELCTYYCVAG